MPFGTPAPSPKELGHDKRIPKSNMLHITKIEGGILVTHNASRMAFSHECIAGLASSIANRIPGLLNATCKDPWHIGSYEPLPEGGYLHTEEVTCHVKTERGIEILVIRDPDEGPNAPGIDIPLSAIVEISETYCDPELL